MKTDQEIFIRDKERRKQALDIFCSGVKTALWYKGYGSNGRNSALGSEIRGLVPPPG